MQWLAGFGLLVLGLFGFASIADEVMEGETHALDLQILKALRTPNDLSDPIGPPWLEASVSDITALGGYTLLTLFLLGVTLYLLATKRSRHALIILGAVISGAALSALLKLGFDRPRPDLVEHLTYATSSSFPSGHATLSAIAYLTMGMLLAHAHKRRRIKVLSIAGACLITMLVGLSRIYLGVHWPTDVLAGWCVGAAWAALWWLLAMRYLESDD